MKSLLFVCLGNICRSPAAEEIFRALAAKNNLTDFKAASAGIGDWYVGHLPDDRMREAAQDRGHFLASRAQAFKKEFLDSYDLILAADTEVLHDLYKFADTPQMKSKIHLLTSFSPIYRGENIPDPFYGGRKDFDLVLDMLEDSCQGLIDYFKNQNSKKNGPS
ncbi:low molecular weight protein-tyrosine-phosphatase [Criblamydia sequanensis]|uniref:protein-tyrosine-phosphatase n=1 Tax=Candidatus Criblamydia sequanensis CRIB-18 TaxID=1437425 RepID=A0A090DZH0_9BACT|nr:low molecular weight protein-tyrosine-phosphatase [Criblamydia sequanensis]CDR34059.1 Low molecular weight protein-tyrosine-phosphatase [Criblamydia sequanensis CRIB-18]